VFQGAAKDAFDFGSGNTVFTSGRDEKADLPKSNPASNRSGMYAKERGCLARS
jgi:hypothetical protein